MWCAFVSISMSINIHSEANFWLRLRGPDGVLILHTCLTPDAMFVLLLHRELSTCSTQKGQAMPIYGHESRNCLRLLQNPVAIHEGVVQDPIPSMEQMGGHYKD